MKSLHVWLLLIVLTVLTWAAGRMGFHGMPLALGLLASIWIKSHFVIADFMDLRGAPLLWRGLTHGWLVLVMMFILIAYLSGA